MTVNYNVCGGDLIHTESGIYATIFYVSENIFIMFILLGGTLIQPCASRC